MSRSKTRRLFVANEGQAPTSTRRPELVANANAQYGDTRFDKLEGREYIVAPMVMITEGVHPGSQGPLFYAEPDMRSSVPVWNHKPVVVYHPKNAGGEFVSACQPDMINAHKVGLILNTRVDRPNRTSPHRLPAEAWLDPARLDAVDGRIMASLESRTPMEISTGLFVNALRDPGDFNGTPYDLRASDWQPDHLAILPDQEGACGLRNGSGLLVNQKQADKVKELGMVGLVAAALQGVYDRYTVANLTTNAKSFNEISDELYRLANERFNPTNEMGCWVVAVYPEFFIYEMAGKTYRLRYTLANDMVTLDGEPEEVVRVVEYRTPDGKFVSNTLQEKGKNPMTRKERVAALIANTANPWTADDAAMLEGMPDAQFAKIEGAAPAAPAAAPAAPEPAPAPVANAAPATAPAAPAVAPVANAMTPEQWLAACPAGMRDMVANGLQLAEQERANLTATIVANGVYTADDLKPMGLPALQKLAKAITVNAAPAAPADPLAALFGTGAGGVFVGNAAGAGGDSAVPVLGLPTL